MILILSTVYSLNICTMCTSSMRPMVRRILSMVPSLDGVRVVVVVVFWAKAHTHTVPGTLGKRAKLQIRSLGRQAANSQLLEKHRICMS